MNSNFQVAAINYVACKGPPGSGSSWGVGFGPLSSESSDFSFCSDSKSESSVSDIGYLYIPLYYKQIHRRPIKWKTKESIQPDGNSRGVFVEFAKNSPVWEIWEKYF